MSLIPLRGVEDGKGTGTNGEKSSVRDLEAESIKQSGEYGMMTTVTETRQSSAVSPIFHITISQHYNGHIVTGCAASPQRTEQDKIHQS